MRLDLSHYENELLRLHRQLAEMTGLLRQAQSALTAGGSGEHGVEDRDGDTGGEDQADC
jgi:hypothetical protein